MLDWQAIFYAVVSVAFAIGGYLYRELKTKLDRTHENQMEYRTHVAENYVKNSAFEKFSNALFAKLDKIEDKLDSKQDKP